MQSNSFHTLVVPVDYTETSLNALTVAVRLGQQQQAGIHLVYVMEPDSADPAVTARSAPEQTGDRDRLTSDGETMIQTLAMQMARQHRIHCSGTYRIGPLVGEVAAAAREVGANLIVAGTRPGSDLSALRRATRIHHLVETAPCPVLTIPARYDWSAFERVLFPVRPVPGALDKYEVARQLLVKNKAELIVLALFSPDEVISRHQLEEDIITLNVKLVQDGVKSQTEFCPTDLMAETVLTKAAELGADLLVITAGPGTTDAFFTGSFARQILHNVPLPVLAIRPEFTGHEPAARVVWQHGLPGPDLTAPDL